MTHFNTVTPGSHWSSLVVKLSALSEGTQIKTSDEKLVRAKTISFIICYHHSLKFLKASS